MELASVDSGAILVQTDDGNDSLGQADQMEGFHWSPSLDAPWFAVSWLRRLQTPAGISSMLLSTKWVIVKCHVASKRVKSEEK